jgi:lipoyl(octanoyl) transferase
MPLREPRDVNVHLYRPEPDGAARFLMLRRTPSRGGFWQPVSGAPLAGESERDAAIREVREETGFDCAAALFAVGEPFAYALDPANAARWRALYGPGVERISVTTFAAQTPGCEPRLDAAEHDAFEWCDAGEARRRLAWPVEHDAQPAREQAFDALCQRLCEQSQP